MTFETNRRSFLTGFAAAGAGALLRAAGTTPKPHRIDIHHHLFPPSYSAAIVAQGQPPSPAWTPARSIEEMDKSGVALSVLSLSPPNIIFPDAALNRRLAREVNEYGAKMVKDYPGRFGLFAVLPLANVDDSLRELEYALDTLKADGIGLMTSYHDKWLGDATHAPVWEELNRRKAVVYTHPHTPACCENLKDEVVAGTIEWATDTTRTAASLMFSGTAARYPEIRWILSHGGGTTPFLLSRFQVVEAGLKDKEKRLPRGFRFELQKFYYDTAQANHPGALAALLKLVQPSQVLFGTDYPYRSSAEEIEGLAAQRFAARDLHSIERDNALKLLPQLKV
ncbi:MAG: amidohydrolase [Terriglobia bacterium]|nr:MAG: amidohydrolase [Terriglobia bacterium]